MVSASTFQPSTTAKLAGNLTITLTPIPTKILRLRPHHFAVKSFHSSSNVPSISLKFTTSVGSPPIQFTLSPRHLTVLNVAGCAVAVSATLLFCSAIPTLLAFKRAAESMEKLLDVTWEELPDTMTAVRLSGMEISDLTTELSDLGEELTQGVKRSTNAVRVAEERLRHFANMPSRAPAQEVINTQATTTEPAVAKTARGIREGIVKGRSMLSMVFALSGFSTLIASYFSKRSRKRALNG